MGLHGDNFCGGSCVDVQRNYCLIPAVGNLRGRSFFVPARTHSGKAVKLFIICQISCVLGCLHP